MRINLMNLNRLSKLISLNLKRKPKIVLNPEGEFYIKPVKENVKSKDLDANIICDKENWEISSELEQYVQELSEDTSSNNEEKILCLYERLCKEYVYDDNVLSYIKKYEDDKFELPEFYGRKTTQEWKDNRGTHNRRNCFEISRILAKSLSNLLSENDDYNICVLYDEDLAHYFVGLTSNEYKLVLDLDNFNNIKDMTRLKTNLTAEGIVVLEDANGKFNSALSKFNENKQKYAIENIEINIDNNEYFGNETNIKDDEESNEYDFLNMAVLILRDDYNIDSQGLFEYMKELVDIKLGPEARKKLWKKVEGKDGKDTRHMRCVLFKLGKSEYVIDSEEKILRPFDRKELEGEDPTFLPYNSLNKDWDDDRYSGL